MQARKVLVLLFLKAANPLHTQVLSPDWNGGKICSDWERNASHCLSLEKFNQHAFGRHVEVYRDHKPLETILKKPLAVAPRRLQGMIMRLQKYTLRTSRTCYPNHTSPLKVTVKTTSSSKSIWPVIYPLLKRDWWRSGEKQAPISPFRN